MKLIQMKCTTCGANFDADLSTHIHECKYCGTTNVLDADSITINKYVNSGTLDLEHEYNIRLQNGEYLMNELKNYEKAYDIFCELYEGSKYDTRLLEDLMISCSHNYNYKEVVKFWLVFENTYLDYLEAYSKIQKDIVKVNLFQQKFEIMKHKAMGNASSTKLLILGFAIAAIIAIYLMFDF